jgi:hypothetical protein
MHTVISTPSSARIKAAYEVASSAFDIVRPLQIILVQANSLLSRVSGLLTDKDCSCRGRGPLVGLMLLRTFFNSTSKSIVRSCPKDWPAFEAVVSRPQH